MAHCITSGVGNIALISDGFPGSMSDDTIVRTGGLMDLVKRAML